MSIQATCEATSPGSSATTGLPSRSWTATRSSSWPTSRCSPSIKSSCPKRTSWRNAAPSIDATIYQDSVADGAEDKRREFDFAGWTPGSKEEASTGNGDVDDPHSQQRLERSFSDPFPCVDDLRPAINDYLSYRGWSTSPSASPAPEDRRPLNHSAASSVSINTSDHDGDVTRRPSSVYTDTVLRRVNTGPSRKAAPLFLVPPTIPHGPTATANMNLGEMRKIYRGSDAGDWAMLSY